MREPRPRPRPPAGRAVAAVVLACGLFIAACGTSADDAGTSTAPSSTSPTAGEEPLIVLSTGGGFVPASVRETEYPLVVVFADRTIVYQNDQGLPFTAVLDEETLDAFYQSLDTAGFFGEIPEWEDPNITDQASTTITVRKNGKTAEVFAYAIGEAHSQGLLPDVVWTAYEEILDLETGVDGEAYVPDRIQVSATELASDDDHAAVPLPAGVDLDLANATFDNPLIVDGEQATTLWDFVLENSSGSTSEYAGPWDWLTVNVTDSSGASYRVAIRPLIVETS